MTEDKKVTHEDFMNAIDDSGKRITFNAPKDLEPRKNAVTIDSGSLFIMMTDRLATLNHLLEVQGEDGKWNHDEYMCGIYNGLEHAVATMENREPKYRTVLHDDDNNVPIRFLKHEDEQ
jgi:hypothetical protein